MGADDSTDDTLGSPRKAGAPAFVGYFIILVGCLFAIFYTYKASCENAPTPMEQAQPTSRASNQAATSPAPKSPPAAEAAPSAAQPKAAASASQADASSTSEPPQVAAPAPTTSAAQQPAAAAPAPNLPAPSQGTPPSTAMQTAASDDDLELAFNDHCRECHSFEKSDDRLGPSLYGVVGRKAGSDPNFNYSDSVKNSGITWDEANLDKWITSPDALIPNNNMGALFPGLPDAAERAKIIAFLKKDTRTAPSAK